MKSLVKKVVIYSMVAILQCGIGAATLEASPRQDNHQNRDRHEQVRYENNHQNRNDREMRHREENARHEREMERRHHESERQWHERQRIENERHDQILRDIGVVALVYLLFNH